MKDEVLLGDDLEGLATFKANDALFLDGTLGISDGGFGSAGAAFFAFFSRIKFLQLRSEGSDHIGHFVFRHDADRSLRLNQLDCMLKIIFPGGLLIIRFLKDVNAIMNHVKYCTINCE